MMATLYRDGENEMGQKKKTGELVLNKDNTFGCISFFFFFFFFFLLLFFSLFTFFVFSFLFFTFFFFFSFAD